MIATTLNDTQETNEVYMVWGRLVIVLMIAFLVALSVLVACSILRMYLWDAINEKTAAGFAVFFVFTMAFSPFWSIAAVIAVVVLKMPKYHDGMVAKSVLAIKGKASAEAKHIGVLALAAGVCDVMSACAVGEQDWSHHLLPVLIAGTPLIYLPGSGMVVLGFFILAFNKFSGTIFLTDDAVQVKKKKERERMEVHSPYEDGE